MPSRISALLLAFHAHTWVFGAVYYWLTWALLGRSLLVLIIIFIISSSFSSTTRLPGRRPGAQSLGLVPPEPALRDERGPHRLRRRGGARTAKPLRLNAKEAKEGPGTIIIAIIIITIIDPNSPSEMSKDLTDSNDNEEREPLNPID